MCTSTSLPQVAPEHAAGVLFATTEGRVGHRCSSPRVNSTTFLVVSRSARAFSSRSHSTRRARGNYRRFCSRAEVVSEAPPLLVPTMERGLRR